MGVRVGRNDLNPLALPVVQDGEPIGLTADEAQIGIRSVLAEIDLPISFRHLPFTYVELGLYEDVLRHCLALGRVVGLGLKWSMIVPDGGMPEALHVIRVLSFEGDKVVLFDDSRECEPPILTRAWVDVEHAVRAARDGFWILGRGWNLEIPHAQAAAGASV